MTTRSYGWVKQAYDPRDWHFKPSRRLVNRLSPTVDLSSYMGPLLNQQTLGSCGPNTADECIEYDQKIESIPVISASRLFIYWTTRYLMGTVNQDSGVDNRTMMKALNGYGYCPESMWPYDVNQFTTQPPQSCFTAALANRINNYAAVAQIQSDMQGCLAAGHPFIFGFPVYQQMESEEAAVTGIITDPQPGMTPIGGHDISICGYTTVDQPGLKKGNIWPAGTFRFRNHWVNADGTPWGDMGCGYLSFNYACNPAMGASDFWVINAVQGGTPKPPNGPPTPPNPPTPPSPPTPGSNKLESFILDIVKGLYNELVAKYSNRPLIKMALGLIYDEACKEIKNIFAAGNSVFVADLLVIIQNVFNSLQKTITDPVILDILKILLPIVMDLLKSTLKIELS